MTAETGQPAERARFYLGLQVAQVAWVGMALAIGGTFSIPSLPLYVITMCGMLLILGLAMRHPTYVRLRDKRDPSGN